MNQPSEIRSAKVPFIIAAVFAGLTVLGMLYFVAQAFGCSGFLCSLVIYGAVPVALIGGILTSLFVLFGLNRLRRRPEYATRTMQVLRILTMIWLALCLVGTVVIAFQIFQADSGSSSDAVPENQSVYESTYSY